MELFKIFARIALKGYDESQQQLERFGESGERSANIFSKGLKKIGKAVVAYLAVDKVVAFGKACVAAASDVAAEEAAFNQIMGTYSNAAQKKMNAIANATGITNTRLTKYMTSLTAKFKGLGNDIETATSLAARGLNIAADASAFWDMSLDDATSHLNSFINGSYEGGEAIGLFANDTQMALYAVEQKLIKNTKAWTNLDEATKQATRLEYAENMMKLSGATGQAAKESDAYLNVQQNLNEAWRQFKATVGEPILQDIVLPAMQKLTVILPRVGEKVQAVIDWFKSLWSWYKEHETAVNALAIAIGVFVISMNTMNIINTVIGWIGSMIAAMIGLNSVMMANPILFIISCIAALVAAFIYLWTTCEGFRNFWINLWASVKSAAVAAWEAIKGALSSAWSSIKSTASSVWNGIKSAIVTPINAAKKKVKSVIDAIKGFFNFQIKWPKIPMPHFSVSPSGWKIGDLLKGSIPRLGIQWYAKGGILTRPTLFGVDSASGKLMAGGEAGREAVAPIDTLNGYVRDAVRAETSAATERMETLVDMLADFLPRVLAGMERPITLDTGALVSGIGSAMDSELGNINRMKGRGN